MATRDMDGEMEDVNPALLELTKDPNEWREQRRRAMKAKIFGHAGGSTSGGDAEQYMPVSSHAQDAVPPASSPSAAVDRDAAEANVLAQIMSYKRRREERASEAEAPPAHPPPVQQPPPAQPQRELSMKEKLMQRYKRSE